MREQKHQKGLTCLFKGLDTEDSNIMDKASKHVTDILCSLSVKFWCGEMETTGYVRMLLTVDSHIGCQRTQMVARCCVDSSNHETSI